MNAPETIPHAQTAFTVWQGLIPVLVPVVLEVIKLAWAKIPKRLIPIFAILLGAGLDILLYFLELGNGRGEYGAALGALGVGLRELTVNAMPKKETKK